MSNPVIHINDTGTNFNLTIQDQDSNVVDLSYTTSGMITFLKPDNVTYSRLGEIINPTEGLLRYTLQSGDVNVVGIYSIQAYITTPSGNWHSNCLEFQVSRNIV